MEENKLSFNELEDLMPKIKEAMEQSKQKEEEIKNSEISLKEETRLGYYEEGKNKIEEMKAQKDEFDDMTKPHLNRAKLSVDKLKEEAIKDNNDKILLIYNKKQEAKRKHDSMVSKASSPEAVDKIDVAYNKALEKIAKEEEIYKAFNEDSMNKLNEWDTYIVDSLHELKMPIPTESKKTEQVEEGDEVQTETKKQTQQVEEPEKVETEEEKKPEEEFDEVVVENEDQQKQEEPESVESNQENGASDEIEEKDDESKKVEEIQKELQEQLAKEVQSIQEENTDKEDFQAPAEIKEETKQVTEKKQGIFSKIKNWVKNKINKILPKNKDNKGQHTIVSTSSDSDKNSNKSIREELKVEEFETTYKENAQQATESQEVSKEDEEER